MKAFPLAKVVKNPQTSNNRRKNAQRGEETPKPMDVIAEEALGRLLDNFDTLAWSRARRGRWGRIDNGVQKMASERVSTDVDKKKEHAEAVKKVLSDLQSQVVNAAEVHVVYSRESLREALEQCLKKRLRSKN